MVRGGELPRLALADGIEIEPLLGDRAGIHVAFLQPGAVAAVHTHAEEQLGYVVSGDCVFSDGTERWELGPGDSYHAPPGVPHGATAGETGCVILDAFAPPREQVLRMLAERDLFGG